MLGVPILRLFMVRVIFSASGVFVHLKYWFIQFLAELFPNLLDVSTMEMLSDASNKMMV